MLVTGGSTDVTTYFAMRLAADGTAATGLTATNFDLQYTRSGTAAVTKVDATAGTAGGAAAHSDSTVVEIDATSSPGLYRIDWVDAAFAAGVREVILTVKVATAFTEHLRVEIDGEVSVTEWNGVKLATTNPLPNAAADAAGGLATSAGGATGIDDLATPTNITGGTITTVTNLTNAPTNGDLTATMKTSVTTAATAATPIAASVTGAVGSVTTKTGYELAATGADLILSSSTFAAAMADAILLRNASNVETTAGEHTLCTVILAMMEHSISGTTLTIKRTDGVTTHATKTLTLNASADPITGIT